MRTTCITIFAFLLILSANGVAQSSNDRAGIAEKINSYLISAEKAHKFNGVALVAKEGRVLLHKAYGWRNVTAQAHNDTNTIFPILSITKSFTAIVVLKLQEKKKLSLKDKLSKYLPGFPYGDSITIEQLLIHTSGLHNFTDDIGEEDSAVINHPVSKQYMMDLISKKPLEFSPGKDFQYNNSAYYLAGIVIEKVTGKTYQQNVRELIFDPLGMKNSGFDFNHLPNHRKATGYQFLHSKQQKPYTFLDSTVGYAAGSIYSTTEDLYKWTRAIARQRLLSVDSWKLALTPQTGDYGIGFRLNTFLGREYIKHSGGYPGFVSEFVYYPKEDVTIILLKNSGTYGEDLWPVTMGLSSILFNMPYDLWKLRKEVTLPAGILRQKEGKYAAGSLVISFQVNDNQLYEILPNGTELPLLAESEDSFYLHNFNTGLRFVKNTQGAVEAVIIHENGKDLELKKILNEASDAKADSAHFKIRLLENEYQVSLLDQRATFKSLQELETFISNNKSKIDKEKITIISEPESPSQTITQVFGVLKKYNFYSFRLIPK